MFVPPLMFTRQPFLYQYNGDSEYTIIITNVIEWAVSEKYFAPAN